ncbi:MAG: hypothetical protein PVG14_15665, partial [Anaerolineales bacterium]
SDGRAIAGGGDVVLDQDGVWLEPKSAGGNPGSQVKFGYVGGATRGYLEYIAAVESTFQMVMDTGGGAGALRLNAKHTGGWIELLAANTLAMSLYSGGVEVVSDLNVGAGLFVGDLSTNPGSGYIGLPDASGVAHWFEGLSDGIRLRTSVNPSTGGIIFAVASSGGANRLEVTHNSHVLVNDDLRVGKGAYIGSSSDPPDNCLIVVDDVRAGGGLVAGSTAFNPAGGNVVYYGTLYSYKSSTAYDVYGFHPLRAPITHASFSGNAHSDVSTSTKIDNTAWSTTIPTNAQALLLRIIARDSAAWGTTGLYFTCGPSSTNDAAATVRPAGGNVWIELVAVVPCTSGDIWYKINASGSGTMDIYLQVWGYWI